MSGRCGSRFFFNVCSGSTLIRDATGCVLRDVEEAITAALVKGIKMVSPLGCRNASRFEITDEKGMVVATVPIVHDN
ncbi:MULTISPECIES: DUF6894 family protein [unclassified Rhizobium]